MPIIITAVTNILLKMEGQYPRRKKNFLALTRKQKIECFFYLNHALTGSTVVMRTDDTDSLVIALGYKHFFNTLEIWLEAGVQGKNNLDW